MKTLLPIAVLALLSTSAYAAQERQSGVVTVCRREAATKYETSLAAITIQKFTRVKGGGYLVGGVVRLDDLSKRHFQCTFNKKQEFEKVKTVTEEG